MGRRVGIPDDSSDWAKVTGQVDLLERRLYVPSAPGISYSFLAKGSGTMNVPTGGTTLKYPYPTVVDDDLGAYDAANTRYQALVAGFYQFQASMAVPTPGAAGTRWVWNLLVNGSIYEQIGIDWTTATWSNDYSFHGSSNRIKLAEGDQVTVGVVQSSAGTLVVGSSTNAFSGGLVGLA